MADVGREGPASDPVAIWPGQIWRDTYRDGKPSQDGGIFRNQRTVVILSRDDDGLWLARAIADSYGARKSKPRKFRLTEKTLRAHYVLAATSTPET